MNSVSSTDGFKSEQSLPKVKRKEFPLREVRTNWKSGHTMSDEKGREEENRERFGISTNNACCFINVLYLFIDCLITSEQIQTYSLEKWLRVQAKYIEDSSIGNRIFMEHMNGSD